MGHSRTTWCAENPASFVIAIWNHAAARAIRQNVSGLRARVNHRTGVNKSAIRKAPSRRLLRCSPKMELTLKEKCSAGPCASRGLSADVLFTKNPNSDFPLQLSLKTPTLGEISVKPNDAFERNVANPEAAL